MGNLCRVMYSQAHTDGIRRKYFTRNIILISFLLQALNVLGQGRVTQKEIDCDDSLWNRVYHSYRLEVIEKCKTVKGTIVEARFEADGDAHLLVKLDKGQESLLNAMNYEKQKGLLVV